MTRPLVLDPGDGHQLDIAPERIAPGHEDDPGLARWARRGTANGEGMVFVAGEDVPDLGALVTTLAANGVDVTGPAADSRLTVVDPDRFYGGGLDELVAAASDGGRRPVRTFGGPRAAAQVLTPEEFAGFEKRLAAFWEERRVTAVCRYHDPDLVEPVAFAEAVARHPTGWGEPQFHAYRPRADLLVLGGEADMSNAHLMGAAFARALPEAGPVLTVDCAGLRFAAIGAWRAALESVARHRGRVRLVRTSALTRRVLAVLPLDTTFEVAEGD